MRSSIFDFW